VPETFAEYRTRVLGYLGDRDPIRVQRATPSAIERRPRYGAHEVRGRQTVAQFVALEAAHDLNHLRQIDAILALRRARANR